MRQYCILAIVFSMSFYLASGCSSRCIKSCKGVPDGKYQSCKGCGSFVVCCHGHLFTSSCRHGYKWDDFLKSCQPKSSTCPKPAYSPCLTTCRGIPDGVYQSCGDCHQYAVCYHGLAHVKTCSRGTLWDDSRKRCQKTSATCAADPVPSRCINSCEGLPDGDYQSCIGCHVYATCAGGHMFNNRSCPGGLVWDDFLKRCEHRSPTCPPGDENPCMSNCTGQPNGSYQSCKGCDVFATCFHEHLIDDKKCMPGTVWDDSLKRCEKTSKTCRPNTTAVDNDGPATLDDLCITNCTGRSDGAYQSCVDCGVFAVCSNNEIAVMPCSGNTIWDDSLKRCLVISTTCEGLMNTRQDM